MTVAALDLGGVLGAQEPRVSSFPDFDTSRADEAIELAARAGLVADPWQRNVLGPALAVDENGRWASFEVGVDVPRQNGKGGILEIRELAALFLFEEPLTVHSAHQFDTSLEAFRRLLWLIEDTPDLDQQVKRVSRSHGEEGIELRNGCRIRFRTRTKGGGRGFSCDCLILDEAMFLPEMAHGALLPTLSARRNPQVWYMGSAVDQEVHEHGIVFTRVRDRGHKGDNDGLAYFEWSADGEIEDTGDVATDVEAWAAANPGLGIRISKSHVELEQQSMDPRTFAVERLGIGDWPDLAVLAGQGIPLEDWLDLVDPDSRIEGPVCFAYDVTPGRGMASIAVAGRRADDLYHVEVVAHRAGTKWVIPELGRLLGEYEAVKPVCDLASPAAALLAKAQKADIEVETTNAQEHAQACGQLFDAVEQEALRHLGQQELESAVRGAVKRPLGDSWAWSRKLSAIDISPLVASTLALWGLETQVPAPSQPLFAVI